MSDFAPDAALAEEFDAASIDTWVRAFVAHQDRPGPVEEFVAKVDAGIMQQIPQIAADPLLTEDLHNSTRSQWLAFLASITKDKHRLDLPEQAADLARSLARRGMDLGMLLRVYRAANPQVFQHFSDVTDALRQVGPPRDEVLVHMWRRAGQWMDDSVEHLIETYYAERQHLHEGTLARRTEVVEALLQGAPTGVDDPSKVLGHALQQWQTAYVVWTTEVSGARVEPMTEVAAALARALKAPRPLTVVAGSRDLRVWAATPTAPDLSALADLVPLLEERHMHVAIGTPAKGVAGFRTSHAEARAAHRLAVAATYTPRIVDYRDVELMCLVTHDGDLLRRLVSREAGALCGADKNLTLIRRTVLSYLTARNVADAADDLFVHKNTVRYRLARAEEMLGHPLTERAAHLELALRYVELFGPPPDLDA